MTSIERKYKKLRPSIESGDIICVRGNNVLPKLIEWADKAYYSHAFVAGGLGSRIVAIQSMADGVQPYWLSKEIESNIDFCIIKILVPPNMKNRALNEAFRKGEKGIPYNFTELPKILLKEKLGINIKNMQGNPSEDICSVFAGHTYAGKICSCFENVYIKKGYLTPQNLVDIAKLNPSHLQIIGNNPYFI